MHQLPDAEPRRKQAQFLTAPARRRDSEHRLTNHRMMPCLLRRDLPCLMQAPQSARVITGHNVATGEVYVVVPAPH